MPEVIIYKEEWAEHFCFVLLFHSQFVKFPSKSWQTLGFWFPVGMPNNNVRRYVTFVSQASERRGNQPDEAGALKCFPRT